MFASVSANGTMASLFGSHFGPHLPQFVQLILRKIIITIVATRCHILRLKCTKFDFGPDPDGGAYSAPPGPLAGLRGPTSKGREEG